MDSTSSIKVGTMSKIEWDALSGPPSEETRVPGDKWNNHNGIISFFGDDIPTDIGTIGTEIGNTAIYDEVFEYLDSTGELQIGVSSKFVTLE